MPYEEAVKLFLGATQYIQKGETLRLYRGKGCEACNGTGYRGRVGIYELLTVTPEIEKLIINRATSTDLGIAARKQGMKFMFDDGYDKVKSGMTTVEELLRVAAPPDLLTSDAKQSD